MSQPAVDLNALWKYVTDQVKQRITLPGLWRAMEAARPLAIEGEELILGFGVNDAHQSGLLLDNRHRNVIESVLFAATRKRLTIHTINGESVEDWEGYKQSMAEAQRLQEEARQQFQKQAESGQTWDAVGELLVRKFSALEHRNLASAQGRYLEEAVQILAEAYGRLMSDTPEELDERAYTRALDRVSERVEVPATLIAHMVLTRRGRR